LSVDDDEAVHLTLKLSQHYLGKW